MVKRCALINKSLEAWRRLCSLYVGADSTVGGA